MDKKPIFIGEYFYNLDVKNRLAVPARFRDAIAPEKTMVLAQGLEGCLSLYPNTIWQQLEEKLDNLSMPNKAARRAVKRFIYSGAQDVSFDDDGRILIAQNLVDQVALQKETAIVGVGSKIEIWPEKIWKSYKKTHQQAFRKFAVSLEF